MTSVSPSCPHLDSNAILFVHLCPVDPDSNLNPSHSENHLTGQRPLSRRFVGHDETSSFPTEVLG